MARYRLMLVGGMPKASPALRALAASLPPIVDRQAYAGALNRASGEAVLLAHSSDLAALKAAHVLLDKAGVPTLIVDDSTLFNRAFDGILAPLDALLGAIRASRAKPGAASTSEDAAAQGPSLREPSDTRWVRIGVGAMALLLPVLALGWLAGGLRGGLPPHAADSRSPGPALSNARGQSASRAASGGGRDTAPGEPQTATLTSVSTSASGDAIEASEPSHAPSAPQTPSAPRRHDVAYALASLLAGLAIAAALGELTERSTRARSTALRRRLRVAVVSLTVAGVCAAPVLRARSRPPRPPAEHAEARVVPPATDAGGGARCAGAPFARFLCRAQPREHARPTGPRPFATLLAGYRRRAAQIAPHDAGVEPPAIATRPRRHHHHRSEPRDEAAAAPTQTPQPPQPEATPSAQPPSLPAQEAVVAPAPAPAPAPPARNPVAPPRRRPWVAWLLAGLSVGFLGAPGWRRLWRPR